MSTNNATNTSNPITVSQGGTGDSSLTAYAVLCGGTTTTGAIQSIASVGTSGQVLTSNGASALPTFQPISTTGVPVLISAQTASNVASINFTGLSSSYAMYQCIITGVFPVTDNAGFYMRTSTNNGSSYNSGATDYYWALLVTTNGAASALGGNTAYIELANEIGSSGASLPISYNAIVNCYNVGSSTYYFNMTNQGTFSPDGSGYYTSSGSGTRASSTAVNAFQFLFSSGNISTGSFYLYGYPT